MSKFRTASTMIQEWEEATKRIKDEAEIRADERRKFAEWCKNNNVQCRKKLDGERNKYGTR